MMWLTIFLLISFKYIFRIHKNSRYQSSVIFFRDNEQLKTTNRTYTKTEIMQLKRNLIYYIYFYSLSEFITDIILIPVIMLQKFINSELHTEHTSIKYFFILTILIFYEFNFQELNLKIGFLTP